MPILIRYFLALFPAAACLPRIARERAAAGVRHAVADARLHLTLVKWALREAPSAGLVAAIRALLARAELPACAVELRRRVLAGDGATLIAAGPHEALRDLQARLRRLTAPLGPADGGFHPHVTLGYGIDRAERASIAPIGWRAERVVLVESRHGAGVHRHLAAWPLVERQGMLAL